MNISLPLRHSFAELKAKYVQKYASRQKKKRRRPLIRISLFDKSDELPLISSRGTFQMPSGSRSLCSPLPMSTITGGLDALELPVAAGRIRSWLEKVESRHTPDLPLLLLVVGQEGSGRNTFARLALQEAGYHVKDIYPGEAVKLDVSFVQDAGRLLPLEKDAKRALVLNSFDRFPKSFQHADFAQRILAPAEAAAVRSVFVPVVATIEHTHFANRYYSSAWVIHLDGEEAPCRRTMRILTKTSQTIGKTVDMERIADIASIRRGDVRAALRDLLLESVPFPLSSLPTSTAAQQRMASRTPFLHSCARFVRLRTADVHRLDDFSHHERGLLRDECFRTHLKACPDIESAAEAADVFSALDLDEKRIRTDPDSGDIEFSDALTITSLELTDVTAWQKVFETAPPLATPSWRRAQANAANKLILSWQHQHRHAVPPPAERFLYTSVLAKRLEGGAPKEFGFIEEDAKLLCEHATRQERWCTEKAYIDLQVSHAKKELVHIDERCHRLNNPRARPLGRTNGSAPVHLRNPQALPLDKRKSI